MLYQSLQQTVRFIVLIGLACCMGCKREAAATAQPTDASPEQLTVLYPPDSNACNSPASNHSISYASALRMITNYQDAAKIPGRICQLYQQGGYVLSETFPVAAIQELLNQDNVCAIRIYNGLDTDNRQHLILVGVNSNGYDTLAVGQPGMRGHNTGNTSGRMCEMGLPCPKMCRGSFVKQ
jgi:hypothetical protein